MPIIVEPAVDSLLTTLASVREYQQKQSGVSTGQDALVESLIERASSMIPNALDRRFAPEANATKSVAYYGGGRVDVRDLRSATAISYDAESDTPVTLTSTQWKYRPAGASDGMYQWLYLPDYTRDTLYSTDRVITITGNWGFAAIPNDVEHGAIVTVVSWLREGAVFTPDGETVRFERVGKVPQDVLDGLSHYRLPSV